MGKDILFRVFDDASQPATCRGCGAAIVFRETLTAKRMPINAGAVPRRAEIHEATGRPIGFYAADDSHFTTCPQSAQFSRS